MRSVRTIPSSSQAPRRRTSGTAIEGMQAKTDERSALAPSETTAAERARVTPAASMFGSSRASASAADAAASVRAAWRR